MDLSDEDVQQFAEADRRAVDPPIEVQTDGLMEAREKEASWIGQ